MDASTSWMKGMKTSDFLQCHHFVPHQNTNSHVLAMPNEFLDCSNLSAFQRCCLFAQRFPHYSNLYKLGHQQSSNSLQSSSSIFYCFQWCPFLLFLMGKWEEGCPAKAESGNSIEMMKLNCKSMAKQFCPQFWVNRLTNNHFVLGTSLFGIVQVLGFAPVFK